MSLIDWESLFESEIIKIVSCDDPAHDLSHFKRVVDLAKYLCEREHGNPAIAIPAAWLHDMVLIPKDHPLRNQASRLSAERAVKFLESIKYPPEYYMAIAHAIEGHSFSANVTLKTMEAKIVQDADRLDGLGAIGIARCFATAGALKRPLYSLEDPFCDFRTPDDSLFTIDHFYRKLFKVAETMQTCSGAEEAQKRLAMMRSYLASLRSELERQASHCTLEFLPSSCGDSDGEVSRKMELAMLLL